MAVYTQVDDPTEYFQTVMYIGNGSADRTITWTGNSNLQADWLWGKCSSETTNHYLNDTNRGITINLHSNTTDVDATDSNIFTSVGSNSFVVGSDGDINGSSRENIVWGWKANGGTTVSNSDGSITSTVQANTTAGFSIVTFTGTGSTATVGHGLAAIPAIIIQKNRDSSANWSVKHHKTTNNYDFLNLNLTSAATANDSIWTQTDPTTSVFSIGTAAAINQSGQDQVCYCFAEKQGFSRFGKYIGNGNANGPFIYLGFTPSLIWIKRIDSTGNWVMHSFDQGTNSSTGVGAGNDWNLNNNNLEINDDDSQNQNGAIDMLSNGFKVRNATNAFGAADENADGGTYVYMAWAYNPFATSTGVAAPAR
jgi:hypothetical protein